MAFKIVSQPRAWWPVEFPGVTEDGEVVSNSFRMRFRLLDQDEQAELEGAVIKMAGAGDLASAPPSQVAADIVMKIAEDWEGVTVDDGSEAGKSLPFNAENVATLMNVPNVADGVMRAYRACRAGGREGN